MTSDNIQGLETLAAWKRAKDLAVEVCREILPLLPPEEKSALAQQIRRAAHSVPANIAEGHERFYYQKNVRFCYIARGSLMEVDSHLILAHELGYLVEEDLKDLHKRVEELMRIINGYIAYLKRAKTGANEPGANYMVCEEYSPYLNEYHEAPESSASP